MRYTFEEIRSKAKEAVDRGCDLRIAFDTGQKLPRTISQMIDAGEFTVSSADRRLLASGSEGVLLIDIRVTIVPKDKFRPGYFSAHIGHLIDVVVVEPAAA